MSKTKYQPGDKVYVRADLEQGQLYSMLDNSIQALATPSMCKLAGTIVTIRTARPGRGYGIVEATYNWTDAMFRPIQPIVIYAKGTEVIALDKNTGTKGIAKCSPDDTFDFYVGAELAFMRLQKQEQQEEAEAETKFKVGDIVVGLPEADRRYRITSAGWKGVVNEVNMGVLGNIGVTGVDGEGRIHTYTVNPEYFRKIEDKEENDE